jgi:hypothetical protein
MRKIKVKIRKKRKLDIGNQEEAYNTNEQNICKRAVCTRTCMSTF